MKVSPFPLAGAKVMSSYYSVHAVWLQTWWVLGKTRGWAQCWWLQITGKGRRAGCWGLCRWHSVFSRLKAMHSSLPCSILCQLTATTCGASVFFNLLLCWLTPPLSAWLIHILARFLSFEVVSAIAFPSSRTLLLMSQLFSCHFLLIVMYAYFPPKCHQPVMVPLALKLRQVCIFDTAGDVGLIPLWEEESAEIVLFLWSFFSLPSNHEPGNSKLLVLYPRDRNCWLWMLFFRCVFLLINIYRCCPSSSDGKMVLGHE